MTSIQCAPNVFRIPQGLRNPRLVALMMPFDEAFLPVSSAIKSLANKLNLECRRADDFWHNSEVIQDVFELIYQSLFVICDFSGRNPNVFYEAGIAHTLGREVIPIVQNGKDVPFDLHHHRFLEYHPSSEGIDALIGRLGERMREIIRSGDAHPPQDRHGSSQSQASPPPSFPGQCLLAPGGSACDNPYDPHRTDGWRPKNW